MQHIQEELNQLGVTDVHLQASLARHTTWKAGGPADIFVYPHSITELEQTLLTLVKHDIPWLAIGRGSNLLVRDGGIRGAVIKIGEGIDHLSIDGTKVRVGGGYSTIVLATVVAKRGLQGFEFAGGIPGNVGGAVYMNAGAHGSEIAAVLCEAEVVLHSGEKVRLSKDELQFRYRTSVLQNEIHGIVTEAVFQLEEGNRTIITERLSRYKNHRRDTQPLQHPCAGSVFRNPDGNHAGKLIEDAGLKGFQIGGAQVSTMHANFIINSGNAKANDINQLIQHIQQIILNKYQVHLTPEVKMIGEDQIQKNR